MSYPYIRSLVLMGMLILAPAVVSAQFTLWGFDCNGTQRMSWQAAVSDTIGNPIAPGTYSLEYCFYGDSLKTSFIGCCTTSAVVEVMGGGGSKEAATAAVSSVARAYLAYPDPYEDTAKKAGAAGAYISGLWLEITFDGELMEPVMRVESTPFSGVSRRVTGDIITRPGDLYVPGRGGSGGGVNASADSGGTRFVLERSPAAVSPVSDSGWLEFSLDADGPSLMMGNAVSLDADTTYVALSADAGGGSVIVQDSLGSARTSVLGSGIYVFNAGNGATSYFNKSGIKIPQGAAPGFVLTSSPSGVGTWQPPGIAAGVAQALEGSQSTSIDSVFTVLLSRTITCPTIGYVLAIGSCQGRITHVFPYQNSVDFGLSLSPSSLPIDQDKNWRLTDSLPGGMYESSICVQRIFPVLAGDTTFYFLARDTRFGAGNPLAWDMTLSLLFVTEAYGTVATSAAMTDGRDEEAKFGQGKVLPLLDSPVPSQGRQSLEERVQSLEAQVKRLTSGDGR